MKSKSKAWIFVSHSTKDLYKVRKVRNKIETSGGKPILFFLKCLSDHDEIDDLIKREIEARNFFLLCNSRNTKSSKWVKDEIAHVKSLQTKQTEVIDLDGDWESQLKGIRAIIRRATVFMSYANKDKEAIMPIQTALIANDFSVWTPFKEIQVGKSWKEQIISAIEDAAKFGFFLHFIITASLNSKGVTEEVEKALELKIGDRYIPILLDPLASRTDLMPEFISKRLWIDFSDRNLNKLLPRLLHALGVRNTEQANLADR